MTTWIAYDPAQTPGTEGRLKDSNKMVRYVEPDEYYVALLGTRANATLVFTELFNSGRVPPDQMGVVDDAIAEAYWENYQGVLMPPDLLQVLKRAGQDGPSGELLLDHLTKVQDMFASARDIAEMREVYIQTRVRTTLMGFGKSLSDYQTSSGEFFVDYLYLQRAVAADVQRAETERGDRETRASVLARFDRSADLLFETAFRDALQPQRLLRSLPPASHKDMEEYALRRTPYFKLGVIAHARDSEDNDNEGGDSPAPATPQSPMNSPQKNTSIGGIPGFTGGLGGELNDKDSVI